MGRRSDHGCVSMMWVRRTTALLQRTGHPDNETGWAIGAGLKINTPMIGAGDYFQTQVNYTEGATGYVAGSVLLAELAILVAGNGNAIRLWLSGRWRLRRHLGRRQQLPVSADNRVGHRCRHTSITGTSSGRRRCTARTRTSAMMAPVTRSLALQASLDHRCRVCVLQQRLQLLGCRLPDAVEPRQQDLCRSRRRLPER